MNKYLLTLLTLVLTWFSHSQINVQWETRYNGAGSGIDKVIDMEIDASGNTYVTGMSNVGGHFDVVTIKYNNNGVPQWTNTYGSAGLDEARALTLDNTGNVIVTGARFISGSDWDIFTLKINGTTGVQIWAQIYGGSTLFDIGNDVTVDAADNIYVVGNYNFSATDLDPVVIKYNSAGVQQWLYSGGGGLVDQGLLIRVNSAGEIIMVGTREFTTGTTYFDIRIMKFTAAGATVYNITRDSGWNNYDQPNDMAIDNAGNIYIGGQAFTEVSNKEDYLTMKLNTAGTTQWIRRFSGNAGELDKVNAIEVDNVTGNVFVTGKSKSNANSEDYLTIAYNSTGDTLWTKRYTTPGLGYDEATDIKLSGTGYLYVTGFSYLAASNNDYVTIKYDLSGNQEWLTRFNGPNNKSDQAVRMLLDPTENVYVTGTSYGTTATNLDYSTIKYCQFETIASNDTAICLGQSVQLNASSTGSNFIWSLVSGDPITPGNFSCTNCTNPIASPAITSIYAVSSESATGCIDFDTVTVTINPIPSPSIYNATPLSFCISDSVILSTDTYDQYLWSNGGTNQQSTFYTSGSHSVTITDDNGCQNTAAVNVTTFSLPSVSAGSDVTICPGTSTGLLATGANSYVWNVNTSLSSLLVPNPTATPISNTTYTVTGTDVNGCKNTADVTVSLYTPPTVTTASGTTVCVGTSTQLEAFGAVTYLWNTHPTLSALNISNPMASPTTMTTYTVVGTDANGCTGSSNVTISTLAQPFVSAGPNQTICMGDSVQLFATGAMSYLWDTHPTLSSLTTSNTWAKPNTTTLYTVTGTDVNGCTNSSSTTVFINPLPTVSAGSNTAICPGGSTILNASGAISYLWNSSPSLSPLGSANPTATPTVFTTYTVTGTDANGCKNTASVSVNIHTPPTISAGSNVAICLNDSTQLQATGALNYVWNFNLSLSEIVIANPWAKPTTTTTYTVNGSDANGCSGTPSTVTVTVNPLPAAPTITHDYIYLISSEENGNQWYLDGNLLVGETDDTLNYYLINQNGNYTVIYTDANGCSSPSDAVNATITIEDVGMIELDEVQINIYPNPTYNFIHIEMIDGLTEIIILDQSGRQILSETQFDSDLITLDLTYLSSGIYFIQIVHNNQNTVKKIVKN